MRSPYISSRPLLPPNAPAADTDVLAAGDIVGSGFRLAGEHVRTASTQRFQVVSQLGTGSYAVVYLVHEILEMPAQDDDEPAGTLDLDGPPPQPVYGRQFALKVLSKANLDADALAVQMSEVHIHQSLRPHPNIVTLHSTLETDSYLLLVLEYVPGEDLFYFLEHSRDHLEPADSILATTPPTPSLLSSLHPSQLLSRTRLRLIASMFAQMCEAVAACHAQSVFHRDIKPENFIVTDGTAAGERRVVVKLTDFGLSTTDLDSADMDCGSAPYMSYECRNNVAPTYRPRAADVWSLGIVLINMLYHYNPWTDTAQGVCGSFDLYRKDPVHFFMQRFTGMTRPVAETLATRVFCILEDPHDDSARMSASEFGAWAKNLPTLLGVHRTVSNSSTQGHRLSISIPISHRPSSRQPSISAHMPSAVDERDELSVVHDDGDDDDDTASRSTSIHKRRKRGARKNKNVHNDTLNTLAIASQSLAREISMASKDSSSRKSLEPVSMYPMPAALLTSTKPSTISPAEPLPIPKKPSKWKLGFGGKAAAPSPLSHSTTSEDALEPLPPRPSPPPQPQSQPPQRKRPQPAAESSASSVVSSNWRSSTTSGSSSAFTRYSNSSARSVSTTATSISSASWRTSVKQPNIPRNIKLMDGVPWELDQLPRGQHPNPIGDIFGAPPQQRKTKTRTRRHNLEPITERPQPPLLRQDASTSTTDLASDPEGIKKVQKGQINALAKMLSALRR